MTAHLEPSRRTAGVDEPEIHPERGFLPTPDPIERLPGPFTEWEEIATDLPKLLVAGRVRAILEALPIVDTGQLRSEPECDRAMLLLSYFGHAFVWGERAPATKLPPGIAVPWHQVGERLGRPPVLSYASYALYNWRRIDPHGPMALGNIVLLQNFLGGLDEEWFILVHVDIEAKAAPALIAVRGAQEAVARDAPAQVERHLDAIASAEQRMYETLLRMPEGCDPYIYYHRVRPYIHGWKDNPALPAGVFYEGVDAYAGQPQQFRGETGAQSGIVPSLDAALGVRHKDDPLRPYLEEMRLYMPPRHRAFIEAIEHGPSIREYVAARSSDHPGLRDIYNECINRLTQFRAKHLEYAARYIHQQARQDLQNPTDVGTGGTPFMPYLKKHRDETTGHGMH